MSWFIILSQHRPAQISLLHDYAFCTFLQHFHSPVSITQPANEVNNHPYIYIYMSGTHFTTGLIKIKISEHSVIRIKKIKNKSVNILILKKINFSVFIEQRKVDLFLSFMVNIVIFYNNLYLIFNIKYCTVYQSKWYWNQVLYSSVR